MKKTKKTLSIPVTPLAERIRNSKKRIIVEEGGTRSGKTYQTLIVWITEALTGVCYEYDIIRETLPALKASALKDFLEILRNNGLYKEEDHNKSENSYKLYGSVFNFYSASDSQKLRGRKRHKALMNEANEQTLETFRQLSFRTELQIILDYNPSEEELWIYDHIIPRDDCEFIHTTYKDNPFLSDALVEEIERLEKEDPEYWKIYGLGKRGKRRGLIFTNWDLVPDFPPDCQEILYGVDFGFNDPKVCVKIGRIGKDVWIDELFYKSDVIREEFVEELKVLIPIEYRTKEIYGDSADPESIEVIYRAGFNIHPADKGQDSVLSGIEEMKSYRIHITQRSVNVQKDFRNYKWKEDKNGKALDEPIHSFSHSCDAVRYPIHTHWGKDFRNLKMEDIKGVSIAGSESSKEFARTEFTGNTSSSIRGY